MGTQIVLIYFLQNFITGVGGIGFHPSPVANSVINNQQTFNCSVDTNWKALTFAYDNFNKAFFVDKGGNCVDVAFPDPGYTNECVYITRTFLMTKHNITLEDQDRNVTCTVTYNSDNIEQATTTINVQYAPETLPTVTQIPTGPIIEGNKVVLTCTITGGNPVATILWECDGASSITPTASPPPTTVTSSIELIVSKNDNGKICRCIGIHILWTGSKTTNHTLEVYYKPASDKPDLKQTPTGPVNDSSTVYLVCEIAGGFPTASINWDCLGATSVEPTVTPPSDISISRRSLVVKKEINGKTCMCIGTHPVWTTKRNGTLTFFVQYAPEQLPIVKQTPIGPIIEGNTVVLTCEIADGNPLATITWECDGSSPTTPTAFPPSNTTTSSVILTASKSDNDTICRCIGNHILWTGSKITRHTLIVYYKPSSEKPDLRQIPTGPVNENNTVTLVCEIDGGFPTASIAWSCLGATPVEAVETPPSDKSISERRLVVKKEDNGRMCMCIGTHPAWTIKRNGTLTFSVQYAPEQLPIVKQTPTGPIIAGNSVVLTCEIAGGNPLATLTWECDRFPSSTQTASPPSNAMTSSVTLTVLQSDNGKTCRCIGNHILWADSKITSHMLIVYYEPASEKPDLKQAPTGPVNESSTVVLVCEIEGGFPTASISWDCLGATSVEPTVTPPSNKSISRRSLVVKKEINGKICMCIGTHPVWTTQRNGTLTFFVQYAPEQSAIVKQTPTGPIIEGNTVVLTCEIAGGNPLATLKWECDGSSPTTPTATPPSNTMTSSVTLTVSKGDNGKICGCIGNHILWTGSKMTRHTVIVYYSPLVNISGGSYVKIVEHNNLRLTCDVIDANPSVSRFIWYKNDNVLSQENNSEYVLSQVDRKDAGSYKCEASNSIGNNGVDTVYVDILYAPDVTVDAESEHFVEGEELTLICKASGNPSEYSYKGWNHKFGGTNIRQFDANTNTLTLKGLSYQDIGDYMCSVTNNVPDHEGSFIQYGTKYIEVKFKPVFVDFTRTQSAKEGSSVSAFAEIFAFPDIDKPLQWNHPSGNTLRNDTNLSMTFHSKPLNTTFYNRSVSIDKYTYQTAIHFNNFERKFSGFYMLIVNNAVGVANLTLRVKLSDKPDAPSHFTARVVESTSVTLSWIGGFNGGMAQTFNITYKNQNTNEVLWLLKEEEQNANEYEQEITNLVPSTTYSFSITSSNSDGTTAAVNILIIKTSQIVHTESTKGHELFATGISLSVISLLAISIAVILIVCWHFRMKKKKSKSPENYTEFTTKSNTVPDTYDVINQTTNIDTSRNPSVENERSANTYEDCQPYNSPENDYYNMEQKPKGSKMTKTTEYANLKF